MTWWLYLRQHYTTLSVVQNNKLLPFLLSLSNTFLLYSPSNHSTLVSVRARLWARLVWTQQQTERIKREGKKKLLFLCEDDLHNAVEQQTRKTGTLSDVPGQAVSPQRRFAAVFLLNARTTLKSTVCIKSVSTQNNGEIGSRLKNPKSIL